MKEKIKVLLLSPIAPPVGGIATWTKHILSYYNNIKNDSNISLFHLSSSKKTGRITDKRLVYRIWTGIITSLNIFWETKNKIKEFSPNLVHFTSSASFGLFRDYIIQYLCISNNALNIVHFRFGRIPELSKKRNWEWKLISIIIQRSTRTIVIDKISYDVLISNGFNNINYLPNPISPEILNTINLYRDIIIKKEKRKIIFVGHVISKKGVYELAEACLKISNVKLELVGPYEEKVKDDLFKIAQTRENGKWLKISGSQDIRYIIDVLISADLFCLPSYTEGFPNVILESMACGCSIVSTNVGAIPDMLNSIDPENRCGTCVEPRDVNSLISAINLYLNNEILAKQHGDMAREKVLTEYNINKIWDNLVKIWIDCDSKKKERNN